MAYERPDIRYGRQRSYSLSAVSTVNTNSQAMIQLGLGIDDDPWSPPGSEDEMDEETQELLGDEEAWRPFPTIGTRLNQDPLQENFNETGWICYDSLPCCNQKHWMSAWCMFFAVCFSVGMFVLIHFYFPGDATAVPNMTSTNGDT